MSEVCDGAEDDYDAVVYSYEVSCVSDDESGDGCAAACGYAECRGYDAVVDGVPYAGDSSGMSAYE